MTETAAAAAGRSRLDRRAALLRSARAAASAKARGDRGSSSGAAAAGNPSWAAEAVAGYVLVSHRSQYDRVGDVKADP